MQPAPFTPPLLHTFLHTSHSPHLQVRLELQALRSQQCSFEVDLARPDMAVQRASGSKDQRHAQAVQSAVQGVGDPQKQQASSREPGSPWSRDEALPSWNKCFRCVFNNCGTYRGPAKALDVSEICITCEFTFYTPPPPTHTHPAEESTK